MSEKLTDKGVAIQMPHGAGSDFQGIIDLVEMKYYTFSGTHGEIQTEGEIPAELLEEAKMNREDMIERISGFDDDIAMKFLDGEELTVEEIKTAIRKGTIAIVLDAAVAYLPSPIDRGAIEWVNPDNEEEVICREPGKGQPASAIAFKIMTDPFVGSLTYVRVYSGTISTWDTLLNPITGEKERVGRLLLMHSNKREEIKSISEGHICAFLGLKDTRTGNTLCDTKAPVILEQMNFPEPVISLAIEPNWSYSRNGWSWRGIQETILRTWSIWTLFP